MMAPTATINNPEKTLEGTPWEEAGMEYDVFALHTRWDHQAVKNLLGKKEHQLIAFLQE